MKKIIDIVNLADINQCYQLELDFKTDRHNLKRYLKSLRELKPRLKDNYLFVANLNKGSSDIFSQQSVLKKKNSELDYYMMNGMKLFKVLSFQSQKLDTFYQASVNKTKKLIEKIIKYLDQSKQSFNRVSKDHEKLVKQYAQICFPQTTTLLYFLGFVNLQKLKKVDNDLKQQGLLNETKLYMNVLNTYLDQMESLKKEAFDIFNEYYIGSKNAWIEISNNLQKQLEVYVINETQIQQYYVQTGGAMTDRSDRSAKLNDKSLEEI